MGKVKIKKSDIWIDMTPMSDVMVLLLTFFMMTSTFVKNEPVKVNTPQSAAKIKVPENNVLNITINPQGKVFMSMDNVNYLKATRLGMTDKWGVSLTPAQQQRFLEEKKYGMKMDKLQGIPTDSIENGDGTKGKSEFQMWVDEAMNSGDDMKICIKADSKTPYKVIKTFMAELRSMDQNRYQLITSFKETED